MTENLAGRGEGLAGLVAKWREYAGKPMERNEKLSPRGQLAGVALTYGAQAVYEKCAKDLETALEAAAPASTGPTRERLIAIQLEHETSYHQWPANPPEPIKQTWRWSCKCGAKQELASWDDCHKRTREHWADVILAALATPSPQAPQCCCNASWLDLDRRDCPVHGPAAGRGAATRRIQDVLELHVHSIESMRDTFKRIGDQQGVMQEECKLEGIKRAIEVADNLERAAGSPRKVGEDGALRERLCERITSYLTLGGLFNSELADHDAVSQLLIDCRAALSLSSPTEPPTAPTDIELARGVRAHVLNDWQGERVEREAIKALEIVRAETVAAVLKSARLTSQASSEIREALPTINKALDIYLSHALDAVGRAEEQRKRMPFDHDNNDALERYTKWRDAAYQALNAVTALAPSRQGADGK